MHIRVASRTDKGVVRKVNEDSIATLPEFGIVVLADGMGGYQAGEVASQIAVETISVNLMVSQSIAEKTSLENAVLGANDAIFDAISHSPELEGMGSTVVLGTFGDDAVHYAHVGDSRLYRFREASLSCLTKDHSLIQYLVDDGMFESIEEALEAGVKSNVLTQGLGTSPELEVAVDSQETKAGDWYLFCSDGLSNMVSDKDIESVLIESDQDIEQAADQLLSLALSNGGLDNVSLVLVEPVG